MSMRRIMVIGSGGAGKSQLSRALGQCLNLPVVHLDARFWQPGWIEMDRAEWNSEMDRLVAGDSWVLDGNYGGSMDARLDACDTVIFLNLSRWICLFRMFNRVARNYGCPRPDLGPGCPEQLPDWAFTKWILTFPERKAPAIMEKLQNLGTEKRVFVFRSRADVSAFLSSLPPPDMSAAN